MDESDETIKARVEIREEQRRKLRSLQIQVDRLLGHIGHMNQGDLDGVHALFEQDAVKQLRDELRAIHDDDELCRLDREREESIAPTAGPPERPAGWAGVKDDFSRPPKSPLLRRIFGWHE